ncbi:MAG TPA: hypothetical protein VFE42_03350 [Chloroflexota bacterium]|nr:hypothetical protein [Chloroflexota bacterium]
MPTTDFASEEIREAAQGNATGFALGTIAYLKQRGLPVEAWPALLGRVFSAWWDQLPQKDLAMIARVAALQTVSLGATVQSITADETRAEVVITAWPPQDSLAAFGLSQADADVVWQTFAPIALRLGLRFAMRRDGEDMRLTFSQ